jgi:hypothetical protein
MRRRFVALPLALTAAAVVAIAGGVTYALADVGDGGVINGCYKSHCERVRRYGRRISSGTGRTGPWPRTPLHP